MRRLYKVGPSLFATVAFCAVGIVALFAEVERQADGWGRVQPGFYAGPVSTIAQPFQAEHDNLSRIDVWAYVDGGDLEAVGDVLVRVTPFGAHAPIRESRVEIRHQKNAGETIEIRFVPIPDSRGKRYTFDLRVLSGPGPFVFVGITSSDLIPTGQVSINADASKAHLDLAMRPYWVGRGGRVLEHLVRLDPWRLFFMVNTAFWVFAMAFAVSAARAMHEPRHWRGVVWNAARGGALITSVSVTVALALLLILSASPHS